MQHYLKVVENEKKKHIMDHLNYVLSTNANLLDASYTILSGYNSKEYINACLADSKSPISSNAMPSILQDIAT